METQKRMTTETAYRDPKMMEAEKRTDCRSSL